MTDPFGHNDERAMLENQVLIVLRPIFARQDELSLDIVNYILGELAKHVCDVAISGNSGSLRKFALARLKFMRREIENLINTLEDINSSTEGPAWMR